tara:strand:+ start:301 stop:462 length:162 start_codon:yes stop_codon:yes gene_type:complete
MGSQEDAAPELETAFAKGDLIVVCWESGCRMHQLSHGRLKQWISYSQEKGDHT